MKLNLLLLLIFFSLNAYCESTISLIQPLEIWQTKVKKEGIGTYLVTLSFSGIKENEDDIKNNRIKNIHENEFLLNGFASITSVDLNIGKDCPFPRVAIHSIQGIKNSNGIILWESNPNSKANDAIQIFGNDTIFKIQDIKEKEANFKSIYAYFKTSTDSLKVEEDSSKIIKIQ